MSPAAKRPPKRKSPKARRARPVTGETGLERLKALLEARKLGNAEEIFTAIADQVVERRQNWDLSQSELAELCGTTQSAIARIERGRRPPRIDTLLRVANALDCDLGVELRPR